MPSDFDLINILERAKSMAAERVFKNPTHGVHLHAIAQIEFIEQFTVNEVLPTQQQRDTVNICLMAVKELDDTEPDFADILCKLEYHFKNLPY